MLISVIIPYRNAAPWLRRCLDSLVSQDGDFEFILVNDLSTDDGPEIVEEYQKLDERIKPFVNGYTPGVSGARNTGIDLSDGEFITFLDADDELLPFAYYTFTRATKHDANIYQFNHLRYYSKLDRTVLKYTNDAGFFELPRLPRMWFGVWNKLFRAEFLKDIRFDESLQYGEDGLFILDCLRKDGRIYHSGRDKTTVKHCFDNKQSLSKVKTLPDVIKHVRAYEDLLLVPGSDEFKRAVCLELTKLYNGLADEFKG